MQDVGDRDLAAGALVGGDEFRHTSEGLGEGFFDQHMQAALQQLNGHRHMKVRRGADDGGIEAVLVQCLPPVRRGDHLVGLGDGGEKLRIGVAPGYNCPPSFLKATEMALANTAQTDNQYFVHQWRKPKQVSSISEPKDG
jgi:hypothetical protein